MFKRAILTAGVAAALLSFGGEAQAYNFVGASWTSGQRPVPYWINTANSPQGFEAANRNAAEQWARSDNSFSFNYRGRTNQSGVNNRDRQHVVFYAPNGAGQARTTLATTWHWSSRGRMTHFDMAFNGRQRWSANPRYYEYDIGTVSLHEFGHALGLGHSQDRRAVMWYSTGPGQLQRTPARDDAAGASALYPGRQQTAAPAPGQPQLRNPRGNLNTTRPTFQWSQSSNTTSYRIRVNRVNPGGDRVSVVSVDNINDNSFRLGSNFFNNRNYEWYVIAVNRDGQTRRSQTFNFRTPGDKPGTAQLLSPLNARLDIRSPTFRWTAVDGATDYEIVVRRPDKTEDVVREVVRGTSFKINGYFFRDKTYTWWVQAWSGNTNGDWSQSSTFYVKPNARNN